MSSSFRAPVKSRDLFSGSVTLRQPWSRPSSIGDFLSRSKFLPVTPQEERKRAREASERGGVIQGTLRETRREFLIELRINLARKETRFMIEGRYAIMGSSNKSRKHYKKDSRFVADLYTFTYDDDLDCVRGAKNEGRQRIFDVIQK